MYYNQGRLQYKGASMKNIVIIIAALFLTTSVCGQEKEREERGQDSPILSHPITKDDLLMLPRRDKPPSISLKQALKIAERFIKKERLDVSTCYLFEAKWSEGKAGNTEPKWNFWWVRMRGATGKDIRITVSTEGTAQLLSDL